MITGVEALTWAKYASGGDGSAVSYTGGKQEKDLMVRADQSEERSDDGFYADNHRIDRDNSVTSASIALELAKLTDDMLTDMLGYEKETGNGKEWFVTDKESPYVGVGFCYEDRHRGTKTWWAYWYYKVQFNEGNRSFSTRGENTDFQTRSAEGEAMAVSITETGSNGFYNIAEFDTRAAALAWLKGKAGVSA